MKNPTAKRSRAVNRIAAGSERVLFLTGTPMENRVDEFQALVGHLRPEIAASIGPQHGVLGVEAFRRAAAPVYLRRNQQDVLTELPELVQVDEWEEFGAEDGAAYRDAVGAGNFMAMRRAAFAVGRPARLGQAHPTAGDRPGGDGERAQGRRLLVLPRRARHRVPGARPGARGPITGSTSTAERQRIVDDFTASADAGGAGVPDRGRRRRPQHPGRVGRDPVRAAGQAVHRGAGDRPRAPHGSGPHRSRCTGS